MIYVSSYIVSPNIPLRDRKRSGIRKRTIIFG